jgi:hypothetical protein
MAPCIRSKETIWGPHQECLAILCIETESLVISSESFDTPISPQSPKIYSLDDLHRNGIWLSKADAISYGNVPPTAFGIKLSQPLIETLQTLASPFLVMYHGTDETNFEMICQKKLLPTYGQLGYGVYVGSFWKACRFACRTQDYLFREKPLVFRLYVRNIPTQKYPAKFPCARSDCIDHTKIWNRGRAGQLLIGQYSDGKWITKNEEWVFHPDDIFLSDAARINLLTVDSPNYNPYQRNIKIV